MSSSTTELIKSKLDIVDFLRGYLNLQPAGKNFKALCPFHREKTASFMISPDRQSWHCFGCGIGGDIFGFVMRYENLEFGEALRVLAEKTGVELRRLDPAEHKYTGLLYELNDKAKEFFKKSLASASTTKKYLTDRGLKQETIEEFDIGWAPNEPEALAMHFLRSGYAPDDILRAGLAVKTDRGMLLDRFRGRIMFPIHNHFGRVVGFTGRILPQLDTGDMGKYINSPETPIFNKSRLLYGFWQSKNFIREAGSAFMVEGQMDFLMSWQAGVKNIVATSGTALTPDHLRVIHRLAEELVLSFDSDEAGSAASERAIDLAEASDFSVKVVKFDEFKDPAEAAQAGAGKLLTAVKAAVPAPQFYFEKYLPFGSTPDYTRRSGIKNLRVALAKVKNIASPVEKSFWLKELAKRTGVEERILTEEMDHVPAPNSSLVKTIAENVDEDAHAHVKKSSRRELIGEQLLRAAVAKNDYTCIDDCAQYLAEPHQAALTAFKNGTRKASNPEIDELMNFIVLGSTELAPEDSDMLKLELAKEHKREKSYLLAAEVKRAEVAGDEVRRSAALEELNNLHAASVVFKS
ncbi:MAG: DNA primase [bacterium]|nr:DNA primase [bacterium]